MKSPALTGITRSDRTVLQKTILAKIRRHHDPKDNYRLPVYRDPKARRRAREERQC